MLKLVTIIFLLCSVSIYHSVQPATLALELPATTHKVSTLAYCALLKDATRYKGKLVRLKATWQFGFETTCLYDPTCSEQPKAWLEFADEKLLCPDTQKNRTLPGASDKEAEVTVVGRLYGPGRYGHLGAYEFKFVVVCLEKLNVTASDQK
jgi:hypothetical protein